MGFIYAIAAGDAVKIGWSADPHRRMSKVKSDNPAARLIGVFKGSRDEEREIHADLAAYRISGEWFACNPAIDLLISRMSPPDVPRRKVTASSHPIGRYRAARGLTLEAFGALVGSNKSAVFKWEDGIGPAPQTAIKIEKATGGEVPRHVLRPDLWPAPAPAPAREGGAA